MAEQLAHDLRQAGLLAEHFSEHEAARELRQRRRRDGRKSGQRRSKNRDATFSPRFSVQGTSGFTTTESKEKTRASDSHSDA